MSAVHPEYVGVYCPTCKQDCVPLPSGRCGFCDTVVADRDGKPLSVTELRARIGRPPNHPGSTAPWTQERIVAALHDWQREHGRLPYGAEWRAAGEGRPTEQTVRTRFGSWEAAIEAAGSSTEPSSPEPAVAASPVDPPSAGRPPSDAGPSEAGGEEPEDTAL